MKELEKGVSDVDKAVAGYKKDFEKYTADAAKLEVINSL